MFEVLEGGLQTTVQDCGRLKHQAIGIPPSGAFDNLSLRLGNLLVGNKVGGPHLAGGDPGDTGLEMTLLGPTLKVLKDACIAITGGEVSAQLNGEPVPSWEVIRVTQGYILHFATVHTGCRAYLCVAGGVDAPFYLGSRSTYPKGSIGGLGGRGLKKGDIVKTGESRIPHERLEGRRVRAEAIPRFDNRAEIRVLMGPQDYLFTDEALELFLKTEWKVSAKNDRMGYRYIGPRLELKPMPEYLKKIVGENPSNIVDDPTIPGSIQWASSEIIVLGVDAITLGGFTKPATVISPDLSKIAQTKTGDLTRFKEVTVVEAEKAIEEEEEKVKDGIIE